MILTVALLTPLFSIKSFIRLQNNLPWTPLFACHTGLCLGWKLWFITANNWWLWGKGTIAHAPPLLIFLCPEIHIVAHSQGNRAGKFSIYPMGGHSSWWGVCLWKERKQKSDHLKMAYQKTRWGIYKENQAISWTRYTCYSKSEIWYWYFRLLILRSFFRVLDKLLGLWLQSIWKLFLRGIVFCLIMEKGKKIQIFLFCSVFDSLIACRTCHSRTCWV